MDIKVKSINVTVDPNGLDVVELVTEVAGFHAVWLRQVAEGENWVNRIFARSGILLTTYKRGQPDFRHTRALS